LYTRNTRNRVAAFHCLMFNSKERVRRTLMIFLDGDALPHSLSRKSGHQFLASHVILGHAIGDAIADSNHLGFKERAELHASGLTTEKEAYLLRSASSPDRKFSGRPKGWHVWKAEARSERLCRGDHGDSVERRHRKPCLNGIRGRGIPSEHPLRVSPVHTT